MATQHNPHSLTLSRYCVCAILHNELDSMGRIKLCSCSIWNSTSSTSNVDTYLTTINLRWCLFWLQETHNSNANQNQPDTSSNTRSVHLHSADAGNCHGWYTSVWMHIHPALLHPKQPLVEPDVLHVRLLVLSIYNSRYNLQRDYHITVLLPPVRRRSSMVVEVISHQWICSFLPVRVLCSLLHI